MKRGIILIIVIGVVAGIGVLGYQYVIQPSARASLQATLTVQSGKATITDLAKVQTTIESEKKTVVNAGDSLLLDGTGTLSFSGGEIELAQGAQITIKQYEHSGSESQIALILRTGQALQQIAAFTNAQSSYSLSTPAATLTTQGGEILVRVSGNGATQVGVAFGTAAVSVKDSAIALNENQGVLVRPDQGASSVQPWSQVRVPAYGADGTPVSLPVKLTDEKTGDSYDFQSGELFLVPTGNYKLDVALWTPYRTSGISLNQGLNDLPVTLGEVVFTTTDSSDQPVSYSGLIVKNGDQTARAAPNTPLAISPGEWLITLAREENPDSTQPTTVDVSPGQRAPVQVRNDLFGGGTVQLSVSAPDGVTLPTLNVAVYQKGNENGTPFMVFNSDNPMQALPAGDYIFSVQSRIAARYPVTVVKNQTVGVKVQFSALTISYVDAQNRPLNRNLMVFIAQENELQRIGLKIDEMRRTPYGIGLNLSDAKKLIVPSGTYHVMVNDHPPAETSNNAVAGGQSVTITVQAQ